jgi:hypothetical protein
MKKIEVFLLMMAFLIVFIGCQKEDGVYNPKRKVVVEYKQMQCTSATYDSVQTRWIDNMPETCGKYKSKEWIWKGNRLERIDFYYNGEYVDQKRMFRYDGKKLVSVVDMFCDESGNSIGYEDSLVFEYDDKKLSKAVYSVDGEERILLYYGHTGDKITRVDVAMVNVAVSGKNIVSGERSILSMALPTGLVAHQLVADYESVMRAKSGAQMNFSMEFGWTGNNITRIITIFPGEESSREDITYDKKRNPHYGCLGWFMEYGMMLSENNIVQRGDGSRYFYQYDNNDYPVSRTYVQGFESNTYRSETKTTEFYEYSK